jgi:hypothetical protein
MNPQASTSTVSTSSMKRQDMTNPHTPTDRTEATAGRCRRIVVGLAATIAVAVLIAVAAPAASAAIGDRFSFAPATGGGSTAPAFTDNLEVPSAPDTRTWWAGVCDLQDGDAGVGSPPVDRRFPGCIEHPELVCIGFCVVRPALMPPLAPGVAPGGSGADGWRDQATGLVSGPNWRLEDVTRAGARADGSASFWFSRSSEIPSGPGLGTGAFFGPDGQPRNVRVSLPPGVIGNPNAVPKCPSEDLKTSPVTCHPKTQVGVSMIALAHTTAAYPVYNVEPRDGKTAEFVISGAGLDTVYDANAPIVADARTDGDFGVDAGADLIPSAAGVHGQTFTFWGVPWAKSHDKYRPIAGFCGAPNISIGGGQTNVSDAGTAAMNLVGLTGGSTNGCSQEPQSHDPSWGPVKPFLTTQTECAPANPVTSIFADNWHTSVTAEADSVAPLVTGCGDVQFDASFLLEATSSAAESATGLNVDLSVAQNDDPPHAKRFNACDVVGPGCSADDVAASAPTHWKSTAGLARSHLKDSVVSLPAGFSVNPSAASGLVGCSDGQVGVTDAASNPLRFNDGDPFNKDGGADGAECPDGSVIGTARVSTPLLDEALSGEVVLGEAKSTDPQSGQMLRLFIVVRNLDRGLVAKIHGTTKANGQVGEGGSGQLTAVFENNPRVPFDNLKLSFKGGSRGMLATPQRCGAQNDWTSTFSPWSGGAAVAQGGQLPVDSNCGYGFAPALAAGMDTRQARGHGTFAFRFSRSDGEQWFKDLTAVLPQGLLASVKGLIGPNLCSNAQAAAGSCPGASRIGTVDAKAGAGDPFVLEQKGEAFLTEGYKGGEYGLMVKVRAVAGPFRGNMELSPIVVRQAIHVDRTSAQVTAVSDDFPRVWHGVPLRVREVTVNVDRNGFMLNPSDCRAKQVAATVGSVEGQNANLAQAFQASDCAALAFKPKLALRLTGRKQVRTGKHPGIRAQVTQQGVGEAGIEKAVVRLPKSLALDVNNAQALCEFADGTKPDLESHCPKGSIVGRARAVSPLLNDPLVGNVYFVKNIRVDPETGNQIRTLPMIIVALRGEIAINLKGESDTTKAGKLVNTFASVPDAPVSKFNLNIKGGKRGILAVTRTRRALINLCAKPRGHVAEADMDGHNGRRYDRDIRMRTPCSRKQTRAAKRNAKRQAANAKANRARS